MRVREAFLLVEVVVVIVIVLVLVRRGGDAIDGGRVVVVVVKIVVGVVRTGTERVARVPVSRGVMKVVRDIGGCDVRVR